MFADDVGLLPAQMFTRMLQQARRTPAAFLALAGELFRVMATGGRVGFEAVDWFQRRVVRRRTPRCRWSNPRSRRCWRRPPSTGRRSIRRSSARCSSAGSIPGSAPQLGAHYTDRDKIMLIVEPVVMRPWLAKWDAAKAEIAAALDRSEAAKSPGARTRQRKAAEGQLRAFLDGLRAFTVLDPACGSGNFLYLALHALKDLEHRVQLEAEALGFQRAFPEIGPANVKGIEINPYAAELARVSVWIGEIQWMRRNGFAEARNPILKPLDTIECRGRDSDAGQRRTGMAGGRCRIHSLFVENSLPARAEAATRPQELRGRLAGQFPRWPAEPPPAARPGRDTARFRPTPG